MKHQSYIRSLFVALCAFFVCVSATAETAAEAAVVHLNPFAFKVGTMSNTDQTVAHSFNGEKLMNDFVYIRYYLNAPATKIVIRCWAADSEWQKDANINNAIAEYVVYDKPNTPRPKGIYTDKVDFTHIIGLNPNAREANVRWTVDVEGGNQEAYPAVGGGKTLQAKEVTSYSYNFYNPISVDIDTDPFSDNFGVIYMVERIDGVANAITGVNNISSYYGWHLADGDHPAQYKGGLYSFDPAFQNLPTMYSQVGAGKAYDYVDYDLSKIKAVRRDASMNANSSGHQGGTFNMNYLFGRVRIAYKDDHDHRVFMSFSPYKQTSGDQAIILGEVRTENYPLIGRVAGGGTGWFDAIIKANTYVEGNKVGCYNGDKFVAGPNIIFDASINNGYLSLLMVSGKYLDRENTSREAFRCDEYKIDKNASTISGPHKAQIFNLRKNENANDVNYWYSNDRKLVPDCLGNIPNTDVKAHPQGSTCKYCVGAAAVGFSNTYNYRGIEYDPDGKGFWHVQTRDNHNEIPSMVHFRYNEKSTQYEVNFAEYICARGGGGVRYDITADRLAVSGGKFSTKTYTKAGMTIDAHRTKNVWPSGITDEFPKPTVENDWATIYTINKAGLKADMIDNYTDQSQKDYKETSVENKKKVFTDSVLINIGARSDDFAWDYADNLYVVSTSSHKFFAFALPHKDKIVSTPCFEEHEFKLSPVHELEVDVNPTNYATIKHIRINQAPYGHYLQNANIDLRAEDIPTGCKFYKWEEKMFDKSQTQNSNATTSTNNELTISYMSEKEKITAHIGICAYEDVDPLKVKAETTFPAAFVKRDMDNVSYSTICFPFDIAKKTDELVNASILKLESITVDDSDGCTHVNLNFEEVTFSGDDIIKAGMPYLIKPQENISGEFTLNQPVKCPVNTDFNNGYGAKDNTKTSGTVSVTFHGIMNTTDFPASEDNLFLVADDRLAILTKDGSIKGMRGFFTVSGATASNIVCKVNVPSKTPTATPNISLLDSIQPTKYMWNGQIYIQRGNDVYNLSGARVK